jgi:hypothetical protein
MPLSLIEQSLETLQDFPGHVGLFGGEPTYHPQFKEICKLYQKYIPVKARRELWTMGYDYDKYRDIINETFYPELVAYNEHEKKQPCWHQPLQVAIEEVFNGKVTGDELSDRNLASRIISNCWVNNRWSAAITPMGVYFCEVAAARAIAFGFPLGLPIEKGWWKKPADDWIYQQNILCRACSACLPMETKPNDKQDFDWVSPEIGNILRCEESPWAIKGKIKDFDMDGLRKYYAGHKFIPETEYTKRGGFKDFPDWTPWKYRPLEEKKHSPEDVRR